MKLKTNTLLTNLKKEPITTQKGDGKGKENVTLGLLLTNIILEPHKDKAGFRPLNAYQLAKRFEVGKEVEITTGEFVQIRELVENNETYLPILLGQALELLDNCEK